MPTDHKNRQPWLAAAMSAPLVHLCGGSWLLLAPLCAAGFLCCAKLELPQPGKLLAAAQSLWSVVLLGSLAGELALYWPGRLAHLAVPAAILFLAAYGCTARPERVCAVLLYGIVLLYLPILAAAVRAAQPRDLLPTEGRISLWVIPALLLPAYGRCIPGRKYTATAVLAVLFWALTGAVLSPRIAGAAAAPARVLSRSITLGTARLEALLSAAVTFGWFCLAAWLMAPSTQSFGKAAPWGVAAAAAAYCVFAPPVPPMLAAVGSFLLWGVLPLLFAKKIPKKSENSA